MADDSSLPPSGRFKRLRKLAGLSAKLSADAVGHGLKRLTGGQGVPEVSAERIVEALGELKGMAMKVGQMLSMDPHLFSPEARAVLAKLQNQAQPMTYETVARVVEEELGGPPDRLFARFDREPLAAASLGQVHRAATREGHEVVVKVQYPGIGKALHSDFDNLGLLVKALGAAGQRLDVRKHFEEIRADFLAEADYRNEAKNAAEFARAAKWLERDVHVPRVYEALTAERVLTLEYLEGPTLRQLIASPLSEPERFALARQLVLATFGPFLTEGLMHVDPHPGNYLRLADGRFGVLDFGNVKRFSPAWVEINGELLAHVLHERPVDFAALLRRGGFEVRLPDDEVRSLGARYFAISSRPFRAPEWDFTHDDTREHMRALALEHAPKAGLLKPPPEAPLFLRSIAGTWMNLVALKVKGPFRDIFLELERHAACSPKGR